MEPKVKILLYLVLFLLIGTIIRDFSTSSPKNKILKDIILPEKDTLNYSVNPWCVNGISYNFTVSGVKSQNVSVSRDENKTYPMINLSYNKNGIVSSLSSSDKITVSKTVGSNTPKTFDLSVGNKSSDNNYEITKEGVFIDYENPCTDYTVSIKFVDYIGSNITLKKSKKYFYVNLLYTDKNGKEIKVKTNKISYDPYELEGYNYTIGSEGNKIKHGKYLNTGYNPVFTFTDNKEDLKLKTFEVYESYDDVNFSIISEKSRINIMNKLKIYITGLPSVADIIGPLEAPTLSFSCMPKATSTTCSEEYFFYYARYIGKNNISDKSNEVLFSPKNGSPSSEACATLIAAKIRSVTPAITITSPYKIDLDYLKFYKKTMDNIEIEISKDDILLKDNTVIIKNCPSDTFY